MKTYCNVIRVIAVAILIAISSVSASAEDDGSVKYGKGFRRDEGGWIYLHIEGAARKRGEQMGYLLASEINEYITVLKAKLAKLAEDSGPTWDDYRKATQIFITPKLARENEFFNEIKGVHDGLVKAGQTGYDLTDIIALNATLDLDAYFNDRSRDKAVKGIFRNPPDRTRCSAFVATGSATKTGGIVMAHNTWDEYLLCQYDNIIMDITPLKGARVLMQLGGPGFIHSGTDFAVTSHGLMITETSIAGTRGYDPNGVPAFIRMRKAAQYSKSIDDFYHIMRTGNNGGNPCSWLLGDINTGEIAKIELSARNAAFYRSKDGYYDGENFVDDSKMIRDDCSLSKWDVADGKYYPYEFNCANSSSFRRMRWLTMLDAAKGLIDEEKAKEFLSDQIDPITNIFTPGPKTIMSRCEVLPAGDKDLAPYGADDGIVTTSELAKEMSLVARFNHTDGSTFTWDDAFFDKAPSYKWQQQYLRNLKDNPWTLFSVAPKK